MHGSNKMKKLLFILVLLVIGFIGKLSEAQTGWVQTAINANIGYSLFSTDSDIFAATYNGLYSTIDDGMPWFSKGPVDHAVYDVITSNEYILAATNDGVYRSSDNGNTWLPTKGSPPLSGTGGIHGPHLFAKNSSYVFVIAWAYGIFRSGDDGENWQQVYVGQDGIGSQDYAAASTCIGTVGERIIIGRNSSDPFPVYFSSDNGNTWIGSHISRSDGRPDQLLCFYNDDGNLFAGGFMGLYLSTDSGTSWTTQYSGTIDSQGLYTGLGNFRDIVYYNQNLIAAVDFNSIQISRDNGITWKGFNDGLISDWTFSALAIKPPYIWALRGFFGNAYRRSLPEIDTGVEDNITMPGGFILYQNNPNPFNPTTVIKYSINNAGMVSLKVYDILGQEVAILVSKVQTPGLYEVVFNAQNLTSGIYFYRLTAASFSETKKLIILK